MKHSYKIVNLFNKTPILIITIPNSPVSGFGFGVRAGHNHAPSSKIEIAHLLEHMMFNENKDHPNLGDFAFQLEKRGIYSNGFTGPNHISFEYSFIKDYSKEAIKLALSQLVAPIFSKANLEKEKSIITKELEPIIDDPYQACSENLSSEIYENSFRLKNRLSSLKKINIKDINVYYKKFFSLENTKFVLFGDYSESEIKDLMIVIKEFLKDYPSGKKHSLIQKPLKNYHKKIIAVDSKKTERSCFDLSFVNPGFPIENSPEIRLFHTIYNFGSYSRIFRKARGSGLSYGITTGYSIGRNYSEFYIYDRSSADDSLRIFRLAIEELIDILAGNVSQEEFERAKGYAISELQREYTQASDIAKWYIPDFADDDRLIDFNFYKNRIKEITLKEVVKAANSFIKKDGWVLSLVGSDIKNREEGYRSILKILEK